MGFIGISHIHHTFLRSVNQLLGGWTQDARCKGAVDSLKGETCFGKNINPFCGLIDVH